ncbi:MAG: phenylalanine--tRNA ligase subunit beta, partial [Bacteroidales bacterium]|nr:phenylalanine--tRNA ligase subunit beta [Bacteroidales bacterium]
MKISYNWIKDYINIDLNPDDLGRLLTNCGLEVEGMQKWQSLYNALENIVIAEVLTCVNMPDSDHLSITTVNAGDGQVYPVVCGAPNVAAGQKVIFAKPGARLKFGDNEIGIKKTKIRGHESHGMICAEDEIGVGSSHEGIMVLDPAMTPGLPARDYFHYEEDIVFEIGLTPNRTDAMSHIGVARDIMAALKNSPDFENLNFEGNLNLPALDHFSIDNHQLEIPVTVEDPQACPRYAGITLTGITVKESPQWLKNRLLAIGLRPINNIVDITNFVLHETGQPLHAFDANEITGSKIIVKKLPEKTKFTTLDEVERELSSDDLMICNAVTGMCIGGVFGGSGSGVSGKTTAIFLESACFDPVSIRKTSRFHDLQTDASFRFERGVDPDMTIFALKRAALFIKEIAGGIISSEIQDIDSGRFKRARININYLKATRLMGRDIGRNRMKSILSSLGFSILVETENELSVEVPLNRVDV